MHIELKESLAQRIVERTNRITNYPIVVMDKKGYIIASTNPARMYQKHGGAILAMSQLKTIEISSSMITQYSNVMSGINLPIMYNDEPIGVIGIAGPLEEVRPLGEMIKMAAELVVEYMSMIEVIRQNERRGEEFLLECIDSETPAKHIINRASMLKVDFEQAFAMVLIESGSDFDNKEVIIALKSWPVKHIMAEYSSNTIAVLIYITDHKQRNYSLLQDWQNFKTYLVNTLSPNTFSAIGAVYNDIVNLPMAFESAQAVLRSGQRLFPKQRFFQYSDLEIPALFNGSFSSWQSEKITSYLKALEHKDPSFIEGLICWFDNNCDIKKTAEKLFIHPNTLRYRIKKTEEICELNLSNYKDKCRLYFSLIS
ncbi:sugar diacid recognition domain-containing protein [Vibrio sp. TH_r3]|uniref:CdaR family transcriptional regulator n=1 Tax=Vibrio sp. TH_r3 TaxID=3082084 RepID=UPI002953DD1B|nr:sugar diacid recognition domain-containing protein [Vibrio sp. TH_r3]MDV7106207.1 sugar diacid recognition domain-containing protein [Vibrio sp. TH_r3]